MKIETLKSKACASIITILVGTSIMAVNQDAFAVSAEEACNRPILKLWKEQQSERLWSPDEETQLEERSGKVFTYNCFTSEEMHQFFENHEDRIENTHFHPVLKTNEQEVSVASASDDDC